MSDRVDAWREARRSLERVRQVKATHPPSQDLIRYEYEDRQIEMIRWLALTNTEREQLKGERNA